jgi:hypothetical protein
MEAYIRKLCNGHYYVISGRPEDHENNKLVEGCNTRRQAIRHANKKGYDLVIKSRSPKYCKEAA